MNEWLSTQNMEEELVPDFSELIVKWGTEEVYNIIFKTQGAH